MLSDYGVMRDLVLQGAAMGVVHVLSGPDHMSALAALTASVPPCEAFLAGVRWGLGHSTGLLLVTAIFLGVGEENMDLDRIGSYCDWVVGFLMIVLGAWTYYGALKKRAADRQEAAAASEEGNHSSSSTTTGAAAIEMQKGSGGGGFWGVLGRSRVARLFGAPATALRCDRLAGVPRRLQKPTRSFAQLTLATLPIEEDEEMEEMEGDVEAGRGMPVSPSASSLVSSVSVSELGDGDGEESETKAADAAAEEEGAAAASGSKQEEGLQPPGGGPAPPSSRWQRVGRALRPRKLKEKLLSFVVGVVHGVGGPGGILGVLPAVQLHDARKASAYLLTFCAVSALTMGAFAAAYGGVTHRLGLRAQSLEFGLRVFSALLSVAVGVLWIWLSATGRMVEVLGE